MDDAQLPLDLLHWALALCPILILLVFLAVLRWRAPEAGPLGMFSAAAIAVVAYRTPWETLAVAGAKGVWDALFILYVVWPALLFYGTLKRAGTFHALRSGVERFSRNQLFLVLAFGWVFASFLQGIAGFGTPIAIVAPLLVAIGVRPVYAVVIPLIGHAWATLFGTLGVAWLAIGQVVELRNPTETALQAALLLWLPNLAAGFTIAWLYGRGRAVGEGWPLVLTISAIHGGLQLALAFWNPVLAAFLAATGGLLALYPLSRFKRFSEPIPELEDRPVMENRPQREQATAEPVMSLWMALVPYFVLTAASVGALSISPLEDALDRFEVGLPFPEVRTGYDRVVEAEVPYSPFAPLTHPGTFLLLATLAAWAAYRAKGYFRAWEEKAEEVEEGDREDRRGVWAGVVEEALPASVAVVAFLVMSKVMDHSGQTEVLARGLAETAHPLVYAFAAPGIGLTGAFMTSSTTASNILFAPLQQQTVAALQGLSEPTIIAAQGAGGAIGNVIAPANVVLGTGTAGISGREGQVLRKTLPWAVAMALAAGAGALLLNGISLT